MKLNDGTSRKGIWRYIPGNKYELGDILIHIIDEETPELTKVTLAASNPSGEYFVATDWDTDLANGYLVSYYDDTKITKDQAIDIINQTLHNYQLDGSLDIAVSDINDVIDPGLYRIKFDLNNLPIYYDINSNFEVSLTSFSISESNKTTLSTFLRNSVFDLSEDTIGLMIDDLINYPSKKVFLKNYPDEATFNAGDKVLLDSINSLVSYSGSLVSSKLVEGFKGYLRVSRLEGNLLYEILDFTNGKYFINFSKATPNNWVDLTSYVPLSSKITSQLSSVGYLKSSWNSIVSNYNSRLKYEFAESYNPIIDDELFRIADDLGYLYNLRLQVSKGSVTYWKKWSIRIDRDDIPSSPGRIIYDDQGSYLEYDGSKYSFHLGNPSIIVSSKYRIYI